MVMIGDINLMKLIQNIINTLIQKGLITTAEAEDLVERAKG